MAQPEHEAGKLAAQDKVWRLQCAAARWTIGSKLQEAVQR